MGLQLRVAFHHRFSNEQSLPQNWEHQMGRQLEQEPLVCPLPAQQGYMVVEVNWPVGPLLWED